MSEMFSLAKEFNQPIGSWNTANVTNMYATFYGATAFDQDLSQWDVGKVTINDDFSTGSALKSDHLPDFQS